MAKFNAVSYDSLEKEFLSTIQMNLGVGVERSKHNKQIERLRVGEYSKILVENLYSRDILVIDMSLNILGHCVMDETCARNAVTYNIFASLEQLFKRYPIENTINERIFRVLRNLSIHEEVWAARIMEEIPGFVSYLAVQLRRAIAHDLSEDTISEAALLMMLRLLSALVNETTSEKLLEYYVLEVLNSLLIKLIKEYECNGANKELIVVIIEIVHQFSLFPTPNTMIQMRHTSAGNIHLFMGKLVLLSPLKVVKTVEKYMHQQRAETIDEMFQKLTRSLSGLNYSDINKDYLDLIEATCLLVTKTSRFSVVSEHCIDTLINVFDLFREPTNRELNYCLLILNAVGESKCELSKNSQIGRAMVNKLKWVLSDKKDILTLNKTDMDEEMWSTQPPRRGNEQECSLWSNSPASHRSFENCRTSNLRRNQSQSSRKNDASSSEASSYLVTAYSNDMARTLAQIWNDQPEKCTLADTLKGMLLDEIESLIGKYLESPYLHFDSEEIIALLINCIYHYNRDIRTIAFLLYSTSMFEEVLRSPLVEKVFALMQFQYKKTCGKCEEAGRLGLFIHDLLTNIAARWRKKEIMLSMLEGSKETKQLMAMSFPYLSVKNLHEAMVEWGGIYALLDSLKDHSKYSQRAISAVCVLTSFWTDKLLSKDMDPLKYPSSSIPPITSEKLVTLELDDGSAVHVNREFLIERSDFFATLLDGTFRESAEDEVVLRDVKRMPLLLVLAMMSPDVNILLWEKGIPVAVVLDAVVLCDKFLLKDDFFPLPSLPRTASAISVLLQVQECSDPERIVPFINLHEFGISTLNILFEFGFGGDVVEDLRFLLEKAFIPGTCDRSSRSVTHQ